MRERAFDILQNAIINGTLAPGERLVEDLIAERCQVSRTPLREAIRQLEQEGLLERFLGRGLRVAPMSLKEASELYEMRARLEGLATLHAVNNLDDFLRQELKKRLNESWSYDSQTGNMVICNDLPWTHDFILEHCHHATCIDHLHRLKIRLDRYRAMTTRQRVISFRSTVNIVSLSIVCWLATALERNWRCSVIYASRFLWPSN
jgi:DNA-binding GntR family transcriptional regulator